jgi:hypothetical protein
VRDFRYTCPLLPRNDPAERPSLEGYRPGRPAAGKRAATADRLSCDCVVVDHRARPLAEAAKLSGALMARRFVRSIVTLMPITADCSAG